MVMFIKQKKGTPRGCHLTTSAWDDLLKGYTEVVDYSLKSLAYLVSSYNYIYKEKLYTIVEEIFYCNQEIALILNRHNG
jgi:hypothetical protein